MRVVNTKKEGCAGSITSKGYFYEYIDFPSNTPFFVSVSIHDWNVLEQELISVTVSIQPMHKH